jgi:hypothetical protein
MAKMSSIRHGELKHHKSFLSPSINSSYLKFSRIIKRKLMSEREIERKYIEKKYIVKFKIFNMRIYYLSSNSRYLYT